MHQVKLLSGIIAATLVMLGCASTASSKRTEFPLAQNLSVEEAGRVTGYKALKGDILIDEIKTADAASSFTIEPNTQAYEGYRVLQLLGLNNTLTLKQQYRIIRAFFEGISKDAPADGSAVRNVVVPSWYSDGSPLVLQIIKLKTGSYPASVILFNTLDGIRFAGARIIQQMKPAYEYPRTVQKAGKLALEANDYYSASILPDGRVTASNAVSGSLKAFDAVKTKSDRINLTDDYLRDASKDNDVLAVPVLMEAIKDGAADPINTVHAYLQLFMYHLFRGDYAAAAAVTAEVKASAAIADPKAAKTEIAGAAREDLDKILKIAQALAAKDESKLGE